MLETCLYMHGESVGGALENSFHIRFDGLVAEHHVLPMHQLGNSLVGTDRIINAGLIYLSYGRQPKRGERFDLVVNAREPISGSVDIIAVLQQTPWVLPVVQDFLVTGGVDAAYRFASYVLTKLGGRPSEATVHYDALLQLNRDHLAARNQNDEQWRAGFFELVDRLVPAARQAVQPIGSGAAKMAISGPKKDQETGIDEPMADAIRSKEDDEVGDMIEMNLRVDGIIHHNRQLKILHPDISGRYVTAEVRDPTFDAVPNAYSEAAANMSMIRVMAKPIYRNSVLHKLYIMDVINA